LDSKRGENPKKTCHTLRGRVEKGSFPVRKKKEKKGKTVVSTTISVGPFRKGGRSSNYFEKEGDSACVVL